MPVFSESINLEEILSLAVDAMPVALSLLDPQGNLVFYNGYAPNIINRSPGLLDKDVRDCHQKKASNDKIDAILAGFKAGETEEQTWQLVRDGVAYRVRVAPLIIEGQFRYLVHAVTKLDAVK